MPNPKKHLRPADYGTVEELASRGVAEKSIARAVGVGWHRWRALRDGEDPRAAEALERGRAREHDALVGALYEKAMKGNVTAAIFLLKCRHNYIDQPKPENVDNKVSITFQLPAPLDPADYERLVAGAPRKALRDAGLDGAGEPDRAEGHDPGDPGEGGGA